MSTFLPIEEIKTSFLSALANNNTLILSAPPGAGKSTCLPLWLLDIEVFSSQKIYLLQPRRLAVKNIACYLAKQIGECVGKTVGYRLRNEVKVSKDTRLEVITEGILTQIIQNDAELAGCALIVLDEFHERSLQGDLAFALARDVQQSLREDLKILLMSATLSIEDLRKKLPDAVTLHSEGRGFPVDVSYQAMTSKTKALSLGSTSAKLWREHALKVISHTIASHQGSILVFLPGVADIRYLAQRLGNLLPAHMLLAPLYGELSLVQQQQAIAPTKDGIHKLVLATNIAETSLTIEGINLVIDCGFEKVARYQQQSLMNQLHQQSISKASAIQRAGRAGRLMAGHCIRLYSREDFDRRREHSISEIQQTDLLPLLIESARWGVKQLSELPLLELPEQTREQLAWQELQQLSIVDEANRLTSQGKKVSHIACHPRFAHMMVSARQIEDKYPIKNLTSLACIIAALLEERDIFRIDRARFDCDLRHRILELVAEKNDNQGTFKRIKDQAKRLANQLSLTLATKELPTESTGCLLALAYPERIAKYRGKVGEYLTSHGKGIMLAHEDALACQPFIVAAQIMQINQMGTKVSRKGSYVSLAAPVDVEALLKWQIVQLNSHTEIEYDDKRHRIIASEQAKLGAIVIEEKPLNSMVTPAQISQLWQHQVKHRGFDLLTWQEKDKKLLARWRWINIYQAQLNFPDASRLALLESLSLWFTPFVGNIKTRAQLAKLNLSEMLLSLLDYTQQRALSKIAPTHFNGPTGRNCPIRYSEEKCPTVSLPMQELYGIQITPTVGEAANNCTIPLKLELLSPAQRPIQVTQNLQQFWQGSYKAVQKEMKSQYPKHYWPDDPANAKATNKTKRHIKE